jgi:hypothetical protein
MLLRSAFHSAVDIFQLPLVGLIATLQDEKILTVGDVLRIHVVESTPAKRKVIDSIKEIGFPYPVTAYQAVHLRRQFQRHFPDILIIQNR